MSLQQSLGQVRTLKFEHFRCIYSCKRCKRKGLGSSFLSDINAIEWHSRNQLTKFSTYVDGNLWKNKLLLYRYLLLIQYDWEFALLNIATELCLNFCTVFK